MKPHYIRKWKLLNTLKPRLFEYGFYFPSAIFSLWLGGLTSIYTRDTTKIFVVSSIPQILEYGFFRAIDLGLIGPDIKGENYLKRVYSKHPKSLTNHGKFKESIYKSLDKAFTFIENQKQKDGSWRDFYSNFHGQSIDWVTAYVANRLIDSGVALRHLKKTAKFLANRQINGGWGYNDIAPQDADSTANTLEFLSNYTNDFKKEIDDGIQFLLAHQTESGGFKTYTERNLRASERFSKESNLEGWCNECVDVTLNATRALNQFEDYKLSTENAKKYLDNLVKRDYIHSYWWESDIPVKIEIMKYYDDNYNKILKIYKNQNNITPYLKSLLINKLDYREKELKNNIISQLIYSQKPDGSWESGAILRFPHPSNKEPWSNSLMWRDSGKDQNRIFTTATIIAELSKFARCL